MARGTSIASRLSAACRVQAPSSIVTASSASRSAAWEWSRKTGTLRWGPDLQDLLRVPDASRTELRDRLRQLVEPILVAAADSEVWQSFELEQQVSGSNEPRALHVYAHPSRSEGVTLRGLICDVTRDQRPDHALEDRYRLLVELIPDGVVVHQRGLVVYANRAAARLVGAGTVDDLVGRMITDFVHPDSQPAMQQRIAQLVTPGVPSEPAEALLVRLGGGFTLVESTSVRTTWKGEPALQVILRDLTIQKANEAALRYQAALVSHVSDAIIATDGSGVVTSWNPAAASMFGYSSAEAVGRDIAELLGPTLDPAGILAAGPVHELSYRRHDGAPLTVRASAGMLGGAGAGFVVVCSDETARRQAEQRFATVVAALEEGVVVLDETGSVQSVNPAAERILDVAADQLLGRRSDTFSVLDEHGSPLPADQVPGAQTRLTGTAQQGQIIAFDSLPDRRTWLSVSSRALPGTTAPPYPVVLSFCDVTERRVAAEQLKHAATHDSLTGLANRAGLLHELSKALDKVPADGTYLAVLFIDLDNFKVINDSLGHSVGDTALQVAARRLRECARESDVVARLGGDEFVVAAGNLRRPDEAHALARRIGAALGETLPGRLRRLVLHASIGIVVAGPDESRAPTELLRDADAAMYQAKAHGRNRSQLFDRRLRNQALRRLTLEEDLREAIHDAQFWVAYQPIIALPGGKLAAVEALARWTHPLHGPVSPAEFIPIAEQSALIDEVGRSVLRSACYETALQRAWHVPDVTVAVNLSGRQLDDPALVSVVESALDIGGLVPEALCLEVTETTLSNDIRNAATTLTALRRTGVRIAIDDFGTGYSSLGQLRRLPVDEIKIDRSFIADIHTDAEARHIVSSIIALAHTLGLEVVAEGVEVAAQAEILTGLGCDFAQGYLYGAPAAPRSVFPFTERQAS